LAFELLGSKSPAYHRQGLQKEGGVGAFDAPLVSCAAATAPAASSMHSANPVIFFIGISSAGTF
jgi:hypothetical protein